MATTRTYYPTSDPNAPYTTDFTGSTGTTYYECVNDSTPDFTDYLYTAANGKYIYLGLVGSTVTYVDQPMVPWTQWQIKAYCKISARATPAIYIKAYLVVNGTKYYAQVYSGGNWIDDSQNVTSLTGATHTFTFSASSPSIPWPTTGLTNYGYAPNSVIFGLERVSGSTSRELWVGDMWLECTHPDHSTVSINAPDTLWARTYNDVINGSDGSANPTYLVPWDVRLSAVQQSNGIGGCKIRVGVTDGGSTMWAGTSLLQFNDTIDDEERCPLQTYGGSVLQDGTTYYWAMKSVSLYGEESDWSSSGTFIGVTDSGWWDSNYRARQNIRFGTSHSATTTDYTASVEFKTGLTKILATNGWTNESIDSSYTQLEYYSGYVYATFIGYSSNSSQINCYVAKYDEGQDSWGTPHSVTGDLGTTDTHRGPAIIIGSDHKIHLFISGHQTQGKYYRTTAAHTTGGIDVTSWETVAEPTGLSACTYLRPVMASDGTLFVFFRHTESSSPGHLCYIKSTDNGANWTSRYYVAYYNDYITSPPSMYCGGICVDTNNRIHILLTWHDAYLAANTTRGISYVYADYNATTKLWETWKEKETSNTVGTTTTSRSASDNIDYGSCSKIVTCTGAASGPLTSPWYGTNSQALVVDNNNEAWFTFAIVYVSGLEEIEMYCCHWGGSSWTMTNLYDETGVKMWMALVGGHLYFDMIDEVGYIYIYAFTKPTGETYFGGELYRWRLTIPTSSWSGQYLSANSGYGISTFSMMRKVPSYGKRYVLFCRGNDVFCMLDNDMELVRRDGADVRIVKSTYNSGSPTRTEIDRLPNAFELNTTTISFPTTTLVPANQNNPTDYIYQIYYGKYNASSPPKDVTDVYPLYFENFETYDTDTDLDGQGGWDESTAGKFRVYDCTDIEGDPGASRFRMWSGTKYVLGSPLTSEYTVSKTIGTDLTNVEIYAHINQWSGGMNVYTWFRLTDETASRWIQFGIGSDNGTDFYAVYKAYDGSWTKNLSVTLSEGRWYTFKAVVNSSGISCYCNGESILANWSSATVVDTFSFGVTGSAYAAYSSHIYDSVYIKRYVATAPTITTTTAVPEISYASATGRMGGKLLLAHEVTGRMGGTILPMKEATERLKNLLIGNATATARIMNDLLGDKSVTARLAELLILEMTATGRMSELLLGNKTLTDRIGSILLGDKAVTDRIGNLTQGDKAELARMMQTAILEMTSTGRMGQLLIGDKALTERFAQILMGDKTLTDRMRQHLMFEAAPEARIAQFVQLEATVGSRLAAYLLLESTSKERIANLLQTEAASYARLIGILQLQDTDIERMAQVLLSNKAVTARISGLLMGDKTVTGRVASIVINEATATARIGNALLANKEFVGRFCNELINEARATGRIYNLSQFNPGAIARIMNILLAEDTDTARLANILLTEDELTGRVANILLAAHTATARAANKALLESTGTARIINILQTELSVSARMASILLGYKDVTARIANYLAGEVHTTDRLMNIIIAETGTTGRMASAMTMARTTIARIAAAMLVNKTVTSRFMNHMSFVLVPKSMYLKNIVVNRPRLTDVKVSRPSLADVFVRRPYLDSVSVSRPSLDSVKVRRPYLEPTKYDKDGDPVWIP